MQTNPICEQCGKVKVWKEAGVGRNGKPHDAFWSCPNWQSHKNGASKPTTVPPMAVPNSLRDQFLLEEVQAMRKEMNERLDAMGQYLSKKLG